MPTILVSSTTPTGALLTIRHTSPELAALDMLDRLRQHHTDIADSFAAPGEAVYARLDSSTATKARRVVQNPVVRRA